MSILEKTLAEITGQDQSFRDRAKERLDQLALPYWSLGRLMDAAMDLAGICRSLQPPVARRAVVTMAGDHGVTAERVSKFPREVTPQMVVNFVRGGAGINALARQADAEVVVVDMGVAADLGELARKGKIIDKKIAMGTGNMAVGPAMSREQAVRALEAGIEVVGELADRIDVFGTGDMGIGNTTPSAAICAVLTGSEVERVTGRGTGIDDAQLRNKIRVIERAIAVNQPDPGDALDVLVKVGGFEIGGIAGVILGSAARRKPVLVDGFISTAGALIACGLKPEAAEYIFAAHRSVEQGHRIMHEHLGKKPLLDLDLRLGEGTGAALAMPILASAAAVLTEVLTFAEAAVSEAEV